VPMLVAGDELDRSQAGNNNAYCQDNEMSWVGWNPGERGHHLLALARRLIRLRRSHPVFQRRRFFQGRPIRGSGVKDIVWLKPDGGEMTDVEWQQSHARCLGVYLSGDGLSENDERGRPVADYSFILLFNAHHETIPFQLPALADNPRWLVVLDTTHQGGLTRGGVIEPGGTYPLGGRSLALLQQQNNA
jgi:isoamylase